MLKRRAKNRELGNLDLKERMNRNESENRSQMAHFYASSLHFLKSPFPDFRNYARRAYPENGRYYHPKNDIRAIISLVTDTSATLFVLCCQTSECMIEKIMGWF